MTNRFAYTRRRMLAFGAATAASAMLASSATAQTRLDVTQGNVQPLPIAVPDFVGGTAADSEVARGITQAMAANLKRSGLFAPIDPAADIEKAGSFDVRRGFPH